MYRFELKDCLCSRNIDRCERQAERLARWFEIFRRDNLDVVVVVVVVLIAVKVLSLNRRRVDSLGIASRAGGSSWFG